MMGWDDFGLSVLASVFANKIDSLSKLKNLLNPRDAREDVATTSDEPPELTQDDDLPRMFKTFDIANDLDTLLKVVKDPLISILIEDQPSTHYRLPSIVLESMITREWYVFYRGRMSFEGNGGGLRNSEAILDRLRAANVPVGVWVLDQRVLDRLDRGRELWPAIRSRAVPFLAALSGDYSWDEIARNVTKLTDPRSAG